VFVGVSGEVLLACQREEGTRVVSLDAVAIVLTLYAVRSKPGRTMLVCFCRL
jgi:hypothetical protein